MRAAVLMEINKPLQILDLEQEPPKPRESPRPRQGRWHLYERLAPAALRPVPLLLFRPERIVHRA